MNNIIIFGVLFLLSLILGIIKFGSLAESYKKSSWQLKFIEIWNDFINFFITGLIGYYFVVFRLPVLSTGEVFGGGDFALFVVFVLGLFGHLCVVSKNITEGISAILKRVLEG